MHFLSTKNIDFNFLQDFFKKVDLTIKWPSINNFYTTTNTMISFFAEPSTRTRFSFEAAAHRIGMNVLSESNAKESSSLKKKESLKDTFRTLSQYGDVIVFRHPSPEWVEEAAKWSRIPVINAGSGSGEHPTQALLDVYTIYKHHGSLKGLDVMFCGDLQYSRTVHSLVPILQKCGCNIFLVPSYSEYKLLGTEIVASELPGDLRDGYERVVMPAEAERFLPNMDVVYMTRNQIERHGFDYQESFILNKDKVDKMKSKACILHPLPRNEEINPDVDDDPRAIYHEQQVKNGLYVRIALLNMVLAGDKIPS